MKKRNLFLLVLCAVLTCVVPSHARSVRIGPRVGMNVNSIHFSKDIFDKENRVGVTAGLELEVSLPLGICVDGSIMYARRTVDGKFTDSNNNEIQNKNQDYITVPINLKWNLGLPLVGKVISPFIYTGPDFAFRVSKEAIIDAYKNRSVDVAWDFGVGVQLVKCLQISATYGLGLTKWAKVVGATSQSGDATARTNNWTVTAALLF